MELTQSQQKVLDYICDYVEENSYPPSVREICANVGLSSPSTVHKHLKSLESRGFIIKDANKKRAYSLSGDAIMKRNGIPLLGKVAAGMPILAVENFEAVYSLPELIVKPSEIPLSFLLRVQGDSMINAGIYDRDIIIVNRGYHVEEGTVVVARIDGDEVTVKRLYRDSNCIRLMPENPAYEPICRSPEAVEIIGRVTGLLRRM